MRHPHFDDRQLQLPRPGEHLAVDQKSVGRDRQLGQHLATKQLQGTIAIPHPGPQQIPHQHVVASRIHPPQPGVLAVDAVAGDDVVVPGQHHEPFEFGKVELAIGVGESHEVFGRLAKSPPQRGPVTHVLRLPQEADLGPPRGLFVDESGRRIAAAVVHDQHLEIVGKTGQGRHGLGDGLLDDFCLVVGREYERETGPPGPPSAARRGRVT